MSAGDGKQAGARSVSLDQFRGYTVLGMFVVNFLGSFAVVPAILQHHNTYCSYADTIMPQFFFAVGLAYRLTLLRRLAAGPRAGVYLRFVRRSVWLMVLGAALYCGEDLLRACWRPPADAERFFGRMLARDFFQTLVHIAVTALWIMPVIAAAAWVRVAFALFSVALHLALSHLFYYDWVMTFPGIDGGPLGFLTWAVPMLAGSLAYDLVLRKGGAEAVRPLVGWGLVLMVVGYAVSCLSIVAPPNSLAVGGGLWEPPFVPPTRAVNLWTMSQRAGSVSYLTFSAGFSLALYAAFVWGCDVRGVQLGVLRTLGTNALAGYVIHGLLDQALRSVVRDDGSGGPVLAALLLYLGLCYGAVRMLEKCGIHWRL